MLTLQTLFNNQYYLAKNPDVAQAVNQGQFTSGYQHFLLFGQYEGRNPSAAFDTSYYLATNSDVAQAVSKGQTTAAQQFINFGQYEGRSPDPIFNTQYYLSNNSDVAQAVNNGQFTAFQHFLQYGENEQRNPSQYFSNSYYLQNNPDVATAVRNGITTPANHYLQYGEFNPENRSPSSLFNANFYLQRYPSVLAGILAGIIESAIDYYLETGLGQGQLGAPIPTTTTGTSSANSTVYGQPITLNATVTPTTSGYGTPSGSVNFFDGNNLLGTATLTNGNATFTTSNITAGSHNITETYSGDSTFATSTSAGIAETVNQASTTTTGTTPASTTTYGQPITFNATVAPVAPGAGTPTGTVQFLDSSNNNTLLGTASLTNGNATFSTSSLSAGSHNIIETYLGDNNFKSSTSTTSLAETVNQANSSTTVSASPNPGTSGQNITLTANVAPTTSGIGTPTGNVSFFNGTTSLGTATLTNGVATLAISNLTIGSDSITANYAGDTNFITSTSPSFTEIIRSATTTSGTSSANPAVSGQSLTLTATVAPVAPGTGTPTGSVQFFDTSNNNTPLGTVSLASGSATLTIPSLSVGTHNINETYTGDNNFAPSSSTTPIAETVNQASTTTTNVGTPANPAVYGQPVTFTVNVAAVTPGSGTPTGNVTFSDGNTTLGTAPLTNGQASLTTSSLGVGAHSITETYGGDTNFTSSTSTALPETVNQANTTTTGTASTTSSVFGQPLTFTANVAATAPGAGTPTGNVTFFDGATTLGTVALTNGSASFTTSNLTANSHSITETYSGDTNFATSTSTALTETVGKANTTTIGPASTNPAVYGQLLTFVASVAPVAPGAGTPTGTVSFTVDSGTPVAVTLTNGSAIFSTSGLTTPLSVGNHTFTESYSGDANFATSTNTVAETVNQANTTTTGTASATSLTAGQPLTLTASVGAVAPGAGIPTGTVQFFDGNTSLGTATLSASGSGNLTISNLTVGNHTITETYSGDTNFKSSNSTTPIAEVVNQGTTTINNSTSSIVAVFGQPISFTATVQGTTPGVSLAPTGSVNFVVDNGTPVTVALTNGVATYNTSSLSTGTHTITETYTGDSNFTSSSTTAPTETVNQDGTTITAATSLNPGKLGQPLALTATVIASAPGSGTPTGSVEFFDGTTLLGTVALTSGQAFLTTSTLSSGSHNISETFLSNNTNFASSSSNIIAETIA